MDAQVGVVSLKEAAGNEDLLRSSLNMAARWMTNSGALSWKRGRSIIVWRVRVVVPGFAGGKMLARQTSVRAGRGDQGASQGSRRQWGGGAVMDKMRLFEKIDRLSLGSRDGIRVRGNGNSQRREIFAAAPAIFRGSKHRFRGERRRTPPAIWPSTFRRGRRPTISWTRGW